MDEKYFPEQIEEKWQKFWEESGAFEAERDPAREKRFYCLKMLEKGLAYKKVSPVNWCPNESTVLSNEQSSGGVCWRCGAAVEKRDIEQWFLRITNYAEQLLEDMREIERGWPERVLTMQRNWIGKSSGAFIDFQIKDTDERVRVFTTRIDTIYGANAVVVAPDHPLIEHSPVKEDVRRFAERVRAARMSARGASEDEEKEGINTGLLAINPFSGE